MRNLALLGALLVSPGLYAGQQQSQRQDSIPTVSEVAAKNDTHQKEKGVSYGRIKEMTKGKKLVIDMNKGGDTTYNLGDPKTIVDVAEDLAIGDPVKVMETHEKDVKSVHVVRDVAAGQNRNTNNTGERARSAGSKENK